MAPVICEEDIVVENEGPHITDSGMQSNNVVTEYKNANKVNHYNNRQQQDKLDFSLDLELHETAYSPPSQLL